MGRRFRLPMFLVAAALLGLIALLGSLQYHWLGQISDAERQRLRATLDARSAEFVQDFDRELTRAYLLFQPTISPDGHDPGEQMAALYDRWQATARFPRLLKEVYVVSRDGAAARLHRLNPATRRFDAADWPPWMSDWREELREPVEGTSSDPAMMIRRMAPTVWESVPAIVVPLPYMVVEEKTGNSSMRFTSLMSYSVLEIDRSYVTKEMLPALASQHFRGAGDGIDYQIAIVSRRVDGEILYSSAPSFAPGRDTGVDKAVDFFQVRAQDFGTLASEIRRFSTFTTKVPPGSGAIPGAPNARGRPPEFTFRSMPAERPAPGAISPAHEGVAIQGRIEMRGPMSIIVQQSGPAGASAGAFSPLTRFTSAPRWKLMIRHPSGSLEAAVNAARRRNLIVSTSVLVVLGASVSLLVLSTRRAQELARRQMEFVAAVSHELRTPLSVIHSAAENLADGVVRDDVQIRKYGDLVRTEGRRLTEMVEQILELAGIQSGQRGFVLRPVALRSLVEEVVGSFAALIDAAGIEVEYDIPADLLPVLGDEPALRRVFQNLIGNAIKYGARGRWIGVRARPSGGEVLIAIQDRGMGIPAAEHARIFEPFYRAPAVVAAQIQGAGLGLSLVKRIVEAHGGRIAVRSAPDAGSEFTVILPTAREEPAPKTTLTGADAQSATAAPNRP